MHTHFKVALLLAFALPFGAAADNHRHISVGSVTAVSHFHDVNHHRVSYSHPWALGRIGNNWQPNYIRVSFGVLWRDNEHAHVYSAGPVWRWNDLWDRCRCFLEGGISIAWLDDPVFRRPRDGAMEDFGLEMQFVSQLSLGFMLDSEDEWAAAFTLQHISNGGVTDTNPGADLFGLDLQRRF